MSSICLIRISLVRKYGYYLGKLYIGYLYMGKTSASEYFDQLLEIERTEKIFSLSMLDFEFY